MENARNPLASTVCICAYAACIPSAHEAEPGCESLAQRVAENTQSLERLVDVAEQVRDVLGDILVKLEAQADNGGTG